MKKILLLVLIAVTYNLVAAQNSSNVLRCAASDHYFKPNPNGLTRINKPCSVCYTDGYFSFYIPELGLRSFKVEQPTVRSVSKDGTLTETLINEEDETMMRGDITVEIDYGHPTKTFVINYTKFGNAYIIQTNKFLGDAEMNKNPTTAKVKTSINNYRSKSSELILSQNRDTLYSYSYLKQKPFYLNKKGGCFTEYLLDNYTPPKDSRDTVNYTFSFIIDTLGRIDNRDVRAYYYESITVAEVFNEVSNHSQFFCETCESKLASLIRNTSGYWMPGEINNIPVRTKIIGVITIPSKHLLEGQCVDTTASIKESILKNNVVTTQNSKPSQEMPNNNRIKTIQQQTQLKIDDYYSVKGIIMSKKKDNRILIKLDKGQERFLNSKNCSNQDSCLVLNFNSGIKTSIPKINDYVSCYGYYELNTENGYMELKVFLVKNLPKAAPKN